MGELTHKIKVSSTQPSSTVSVHSSDNSFWCYDSYWIVIRFCVQSFNELLFYGDIIILILQRKKLWGSEGINHLSKGIQPISHGDGTQIHAVSFQSLCTYQYQILPFSAAGSQYLLNESMNKWTGTLLTSEKFCWEASKKLKWDLASGV